MIPMDRSAKWQADGLFSERWETTTPKRSQTTDLATSGFLCILEQTTLPTLPPDNMGRSNGCFLVCFNDDIRFWSDVMLGWNTLPVRKCHDYQCCWELLPGLALFCSPAQQRSVALPCKQWWECPGHLMSCMHCFAKVGHGRPGQVAVG